MKLNNYVDATILTPSATRNAYLQLCRDAIQYEFAAVCVPPFMIETCKQFSSNSDLKLASVIGFPAGYQTLDTKLFELQDAIRRGVNEIDYVIHRGYLADSNWERLEYETTTWINICKTAGVQSKWIIESSELDPNQLTRLIEMANSCKPDYVKTSTGVYGKATLKDIKLLRECLLPEIKIKAAGGISTKELAEEMIKAGADRLGVSQYHNLLS